MGFPLTDFPFFYFLPLFNFFHLSYFTTSWMLAQGCVDHLRPTTEMYWYNYVNSYMTGRKCTGTIMYVLLHFPPKMYWYTLGQTVVALAHRYRQTTNNVDRELTELP